MVCIFHQNMRVFGGCSPPRNAAYSGAFTAINAALPPGTGPIAVAGFTEITNGATSNRALGPPVNLCGTLGTNFYSTVACGETVLAHGPEFIGIGVNAAYTVLSIGRIFLNVDRGIKLEDDISPALPPTNTWLNTVPEKASYDYRGLVYVVISDALANIFVVGFLHNRCPGEDQGPLIAQKIPYMAQMIKNKNPLVPVGAHVYIGGDFNVLPIQHRHTSTGYNIYAYSTGLPPGLLPNPPIIPGGTTQRGNLFDYWYSDIPPGGAIPVASVHHDTMSPVYPGPVNLSDHVATTLRI